MFWHTVAHKKGLKGYKTVKCCVFNQTLKSNSWNAVIANLCVCVFFECVYSAAVWQHSQRGHMGTAVTSNLQDHTNTPQCTEQWERERICNHGWATWLNKNFRTNKDPVIFRTTKCSPDHWMVIGKRKIIISIILSWWGYVLAGFLVLFWTRIAHARSDL